MTEENSQLYCRAEWMSATEFLSEDGPYVLNMVSDRVEKLLESGQTPVVVFDLDSTLYEVQPRTFQIVQEFLNDPVSFEVDSQVSNALKYLQVGQLEYSIRDAFRNLGLDTNAAHVQAGLDTLGDFWWKRFFQNEYMRYDVAYPGTQAYVNRLFKLGATLVYLTGRDFPNMGDGTIATMKRDGFPVEHERIVPMLKPDASMDDKKFKEEAIQKIASLGTLVASFENEPANLVAMQEKLPDAIHVFVETISSDHTCQPGRNLYKIKGFSL